MVAGERAREEICRSIGRPTRKTVGQWEAGEERLVRGWTKWMAHLHLILQGTRRGQDLRAQGCPRQWEAFGIPVPQSWP